MSVNNFYTCFAHRIWFDAENPNKGSATNLYEYKSGTEVRVVFDYHTTASFDTLQVSPEYVGRAIEVVEKSANITVHSEEVLQDGIVVSCVGSNYGYCVLRLL